MDRAFRRILLVAVAAVLAALAPSAFADSLVAVDGSSAFGYNGYGIPPYGGTLNGQAAQFYCVDFQHDIVGGDYWNAVSTAVTPGGNYSATYLGSANTYEEIAWLLTKEMGAPDQNTAAAYQWAIWSLTGGPDPFTGPLSASMLIANAQNAVNGGFNGAGWVILTPDKKTYQYGQEFMVYVPEPGTLALLALGLGALMFLKRKPALQS